MAGCWDGVPIGLAGANAGLAGAGLAGTGAGWADAAEQSTRDAAIVAIATRIPDERAGINVTGGRMRKGKPAYMRTVGAQ
jgi:hypothetical protein